VFVIIAFVFGIVFLFEGSLGRVTCVSVVKVFFGCFVCGVLGAWEVRCWREESGREAGSGLYGIYYMSL
jgi:hypothetical protein